MPSFYLLTTGSAAQAQDVNQIIEALRGDAGQGIPISLTALSDSTNFVLALKNADPTNSRVLQVLRANNNVLLQADASGVIVSPDGGAASAQVVNISLAQTLTNKTLTAPALTGPVVLTGSTNDNSAYALQVRNLAGTQNNLLVRNDGQVLLGQGGSVTVAPGTNGAVTFAGPVTLPGGANLVLTTATLTNGAGAQAGTLTNAPAAGNPTKWIPISDGGVTRLIPAW